LKASPARKLPLSLQPLRQCWLAQAPHRHHPILLHHPDTTPCHGSKPQPSSRLQPVALQHHACRQQPQRLPPLSQGYNYRRQGEGERSRVAIKPCPDTAGCHWSSRPTPARAHGRAGDTHASRGEATQGSSSSVPAWRPCTTRPKLWGSRRSEAAAPRGRRRRRRWPGRRRLPRVRMHVHARERAWVAAAAADN
jgi:hypothetical protein